LGIKRIDFGLDIQEKRWVFTGRMTLSAAKKDKGRRADPGEAGETDGGAEGNGA